MHATAQSSFSLPPHVPLIPGPSSSLKRPSDVIRLFSPASGSCAGDAGLKALSSAVTNSEEMRIAFPEQRIEQFNDTGLLVLCGGGHWRLWAKAGRRAQARVPCVVQIRAPG